MGTTKVKDKVLTTESVIRLLREDSWEISQMITNQTLSVYVEHTLELLRDEVRMVLRPLTERVDQVIVAYPASSWQHLKRDILPSWLLERFPVIEEGVVVDIKAAYPLVSLPEEKFHVYFTKTFSNPLDTRE